METLKSLINEFAILRLTGNGFKNPTTFNDQDEENIERQDMDDPIDYNRTDQQDDDQNFNDLNSEEGIEVDPTNGCDCECCEKWKNFFSSLYDKDNNEESEDNNDEYSGEDVWDDKNGDVNKLKYKETPEDDEIEDEYLPASWPH